MPRRHGMVISALVALAATSAVLAKAQNPGNARPGTARQEQPAAKPAQVAQQFPPGAMDEVLSQWEIQSKKLTSLEVDIQRTDIDRAWGDEALFSGHAAFQSPDLAFVDYRKIKGRMQADPKVKNKEIFVAETAKDGKRIEMPFETIVCTGKEVWQYRFDVKQVYIFPLDKDARRKALDEGPLPFLFRMRAGDAKQRYTMALRKQDAKLSLIEIQPNLKEDKAVFSTAWVYLDRKYLVPKRIYLISPDKSKIQDFILSNIKANEPVKQEYFVGVKPGKPWKVEINPGGAQAAGRSSQARSPQG